MITLKQTTDHLNKDILKDIENKVVKYIDIGTLKVQKGKVYTPFESILVYKTIRILKVIKPEVSIKNYIYTMITLSSDEIQRLRNLISVFRENEYKNPTAKYSINDLLFPDENNNLIIINQKEAKLFTNIYEKLFKTIYTNESNESHRLSFWIADNMNSRVCPYCNRNYINKRTNKSKNDIYSTQLDHIFSKDVFPILAFSLNNLIPVCQQCNHIKSNEHFSITPFSYNDSSVSFIINLFKDLKFEISSTSPDVENSLEILGLNSAYDIHKEDFEDLWNRSYLYPDAKMIEVFKSLKSNISNLNYEEFIFGKLREPDEDGLYS